MRKLDMFRTRPMPPAVEVVTRSGGRLDRLIKCPNPTCRGRHYESLIGPGDTCLNCGTQYRLDVQAPSEDHLYTLYGHVRFYAGK